MVWCDARGSGEVSPLLSGEWQHTEASRSRIAEDVATAPQEKNILIDAFAGTGGNTIAFALSGRWNQIFAVEKDEATLNCAKHNAEIYGVSRKITWIHGDVFEALQRRLKFVAKKAVIFGSPPWGGQYTYSTSRLAERMLTCVGPDYSYYDIFDLDLMEPYTLDDMHTAFTKVASHAVLYLPRQSDIRQLARHADESRKLKVRHYCANLNSKALCVYYGDFGFE